MKPMDKKRKVINANKNKKRTTGKFSSAFMKFFNASEKTLAFVSIPFIIFSVIMTVFSIRSQKIVDSYSLKEFSAERNLILKIVSIEKKDTQFIVAPTQDDMKIQNCLINYPKEFPIDITSSFPQVEKTPFNYSMAQETISKFIKSIPTLPQKNYAVMPAFDVPVIFSCDYIAKGERYNNIGFYYLQFTLTIGNSSEEPIVDFSGMRYVGTISSEDDANSLVNNFWELIKNNLINTLKSFQ
jgi:hypothetical protein